MPIYEYRCGGCRRKVTILTLRVSEQVDPVCEHCGSRQLARLMSRFAMVRSEDARLDDLSDSGPDENDPKSMARWMRKMGKELGEDADDDFDEMVNELEAGGGAGDEGEDAGSDSSADEDDF